MDTQIHTSFIPKKSLEAKTERHRSPVGFVVVIGIALFILSLIGWGGAYAYVGYLKGEVDRQKSDLIKEKEAFDPQLLAQFEETDRKLIAARELLDRHTTLVPFFDTLEQLTLRTVQFDSLEYMVDAQGVHQLTLSGQAASYEAIALQADQLAAHPQIINPVFSDFVVNQSGRVQFILRMGVHPDLVSYRKNLNLDIMESENP
ncbi:MAG TPA: hypothetical protein VJJ24_02210 [Candidatus Paceibacterota bacterium]